MRKELRRIVQAGCLIDPERPYTLEQITSDRENALALWKLRFAVSAADEKLDACGIAVECYVHAKSNALRVFALAKSGELAMKHRSFVEYARVIAIVARTSLLIS